MSTFDKCPHQQLPMINSEPLKLHMDVDAKPSAVFTAATVPIHWRDKIKDQLDEDVALRVLEKMPAGEPTLWQARMHVQLTLSIWNSQGTRKFVRDRESLR